MKNLNNVLPWSLVEEDSGLMEWDRNVIADVLKQLEIGNTFVFSKKIRNIYSPFCNMVMFDLKYKMRMDENNETEIWLNNDSRRRFMKEMSSKVYTN